MAVEEDVETYHHDDKQGPGYLYATGGRLHKFLHIGNLLLALVRQGDGDHGHADDDEYPEGEHHEMRPERGSVEYEEVENAGADTEDGSPGERHVGGSGGAALPEYTEKEDGSHRRGDESQYRLEDIEEVEALDAVDGNADKH